VGSGNDIAINKLAEIIQTQIGHQGKIIWDAAKPDGTPRKWMDSSKMNKLGWFPKYNLDNGIASAYSWFLENVEKYKEVVF
jgi:GDP-L-fucose synthase